nr:MAG TPA: Membrane fusion protein p14 fusion protein transmembrane domain [Caudoviricetes sp.]DAM27438.1 MAG TPA: Membrane fusion protein p14 fusion protein transmembrane domain [Caudoviricetes sp.]
MALVFFISVFLGMYRYTKVKKTKHTSQENDTLTRLS